VSAFYWLLIVGAWGVLCSLYGDREGKKRGYELGKRDGQLSGYRDGFTAGRAAETGWLSNVECEVRKAQEEIWREEG